VDRGRLLGIDYGTKRVGIAVSDPEGRLAVPWGAVRRRDDRSLVRQLVALAEREGVTGFVVGEPRGLDGHAGDAARRVQRFATRLGETSGLPVDLVDEALTSVEAEERLRRAGVDPAETPERIDAVAAQILLQEALDRPSPADPTDPASSASSAKSTNPAKTTDSAEETRS